MIQEKFTTNQQSPQEVRGFFWSDNQKIRFLKSIKPTKHHRVLRECEGIILYPRILFTITPNATSFIKHNFIKYYKTAKGP